jgi:hypothetical protein
VLSSRRSIVVVASLSLPLFASPLLGAQAGTGKEPCRWVIHQPTMSICVKLPDPSPGETEEQQRAVAMDLVQRIDEIKKLATISADLHWLMADIEHSNNVVEQERRIRIIGRTSRGLCRDRNAHSACDTSFHPDPASDAGKLERDVVLRTMQIDVSLCLRALENSGTSDVRYPARLQNIAAGAVRLSALLQADPITSASR